MPKFTITTTARATIGEEWTIEADDMETAIEAFDDVTHPAYSTLQIIRDWTVGDEEGREVTDCEEATPT